MEYVEILKYPFTLYREVELMNEGILLGLFRILLSPFILLIKYFKT